MIRFVLKYAAVAGLAIYVLLQARKPTKWVGRIFLQAMNEGHSRLTEWGLTHTLIESHFTILDIGCGGGRTVHKLAAVANEGLVFGIDYAKGSIVASRAETKELIKAGRVAIEQATVSQLPFANEKFDLVTAIETQYYWPNLKDDMREVLRVLKPGGTLIVIAETYKGGKYDKLKWPVMWLLRSSHLSVSDHRDVFSTAGYTEVKIYEERKKGWICAIGTKPPVRAADVDSSATMPCSV